MIQGSAEALINAPRSVVFDVLTDRNSYHRFLPIRVTQERPGVDELQGVGAVHKLGIGPVGAREQVEVFEAPRRYEFRLLSGLPIRDHRVVVTFVEGPSGTRVRYDMRFTPPVPVPQAVAGLVLKVALTGFLLGVRLGVKRHR